MPSLRTGQNHRREVFKKRAVRAADTHRQLVPSVEGGSVQYKCGTAARRRLVKKSYRVRPRERTTTTQRAVAQEASFKTMPKKKNISTVRLLEAGARAVATKLLRLTPTGVRNEQAAVVRKEQVLDLLLGCLVHVCELQSPRHTTAREGCKYNKTQRKDGQLLHHRSPRHTPMRRTAQHRASRSSRELHHPTPAHVTSTAQMEKQAAGLHRVDKH